MGFGGGVGCLLSFDDEVLLVEVILLWDDLGSLLGDSPFDLIDCAVSEKDGNWVSECLRLLLLLLLLLSLLLFNAEELFVFCNSGLTSVVSVV